MPATMPAGEFKAKCLKVLDQVAESREPVVITKHGKPVAQLVPMAAEGNFVGSMKGTGVILGDIISPIDVEWEAMK